MMYMRRGLLLPSSFYMDIWKNGNEEIKGNKEKFDMTLEGFIYIFVMDLIWSSIVCVSDFILNSFLDDKFDEDKTIEEVLLDYFYRVFLPFYIGGVLIYGSNIWNL